MRASFEFIKGTGEHCLLPFIQPTFTSSHAIQGYTEQLALSCMTTIFCNDFVPAVQDRWFQWDEVDLPTSMNESESTAFWDMY